MPTLDFHLGPEKAPAVEINPIDKTVDLVWESSEARTIITLRNLKELRVLMTRAIEAVQSEHIDVPTPA